MIYVLCPGNFKSGGPELLHQLVNQINSIKGEVGAKIAYFNYSDKLKPYDDSLVKYVPNAWTIESDVIDDSDNIVVIPEMFVNKMKNYKKSKRYIWWMSVDNFKFTNSFRDMWETGGFSHAVKWTLKGKGYNKVSLVKQADMQLCQSYYSLDYLMKLGLPPKKCKFLSDYLNKSYLNNLESLNYPKKDIVLYNPKKGMKFTKRIIESSSKNVNWMPLINMTNSEVQDLMRKAKVYIDFGEHPGKDRIPRESAISGCCVITDKQGSAAYYKDVPIMDEFKFDRKKENIPRILDKIYDCLKNYDKNSKKFESYRSHILGERSQFESDVKAIFDLS